MKKTLNRLAVAVLGAVMVASCSPSADDFNPGLLTADGGKWTLTRDSGDGPEELLHIFNSDGTGSETNITQGGLAQAFKWSLDGTVITFIHQGTMGFEAPEEYTVKSLTSTRFVYEDDWGKQYVCTKVHDVE